MSRIAIQRDIYISHALVVALIYILSSYHCHLGRGSVRRALCKFTNDLPRVLPW